MELRSKAKHGVVEAMLAVGDVRLGVNPRQGEVVLPVQFMGRDYVGLRFGENVPMFNLSLDDRGISATLNFDEEPFDAYIPWASVFAISTDCGDLLFQEEAPPFMQAETVEPQAVACGGADSSDAATEFDADVPTQTRRTRPEWLRLI